MDLFDSRGLAPSTKVQIIQEAIKLFKEKRYQNVSVSEICASAKITRTTFYYYFKNKEHLVGEFVATLDSKVVDMLPVVLAEDTYYKQVWAIYRTILEEDLEAGADILRMVNISKLRLCKQSFPQDSRYWDTLVTLTRKCQESGQIQNMMMPDDLLEATFFMVQGIVLIWSLNNGEFDLLEMSKHCLNAIFMPTPGYEL